MRKFLWVFLLAAWPVPAAVAQTDKSVDNRDILNALSEIKLEMVRIEQSLKGDMGRLETRLQATDKRLDDMQQATNQRLDDMERATTKRLDDMERATTKRLDDIQVDMQDMRADIRDVRADIRDLRTNIWWVVGLVFTALLGMVGFAVWDRRSALAPATRRIERVEVALKEMAGVIPWWPKHCARQVSFSARKSRWHEHRSASPVENVVRSVGD